MARVERMDGQQTLIHRYGLGYQRNSGQGGTDRRRQREQYKKSRSREGKGYSGQLGTDRRGMNESGSSDRGRRSKGAPEGGQHESRSENDTGGRTTGGRRTEAGMVVGKAQESGEQGVGQVCGVGYGGV